MTTTSSKPHVPWRRTLAVASRWLHIYLSMISFTIVLFFAVTGLTLNHPTWFSHQQHTTESHATVPRGLLQGPAPSGVDQLGLAEWLRTHDHVHGTLTDFRVEDSQVSISFRAPGYTADAFVDRPSGKYDLTVVASGPAAILNDLHRGRDAGKAWGWLIDVSAILLTLVSLTGLVLVWFLIKRRTSGLLLASIATCIIVLLVALFVP